jgi:hypothetical protein
VTHYDSTQSMQLHGSVADFSFGSPHSFLYLDAENESGDTVRWEIEMGSIPLLRRQGFSGETFNPGDQVTVNVWPNRVPNNPLVWSIGVITADGTALGGFPPTPTVESSYLDASGVARLQGRWRASVFQIDSNESPLPLTPAGVSAVRNYDPQESPANSCEPNNVPATWHNPYQFELLIGEREAVVRHELYSVTRTVPLDSAPQRVEPSGVFGLASGRIDGRELVIESTDFPASGWGLGTAADNLGVGTDIPSSDGKRLIERISVSDDGQNLTVQYTVEDPVYLTRPYTGTAVLARVPDDEPLHPYNCELDRAERFSRDP